MKLLLREGLGSEDAMQVGVLGGVVALIPVAATGLLYFPNLYGPFGEHRMLGGLAGLACGPAAGVASFWLTWRMARRSRGAVVILIGVIVAAGLVLFPREVDVSESWVPRPNERSSCTGWSFRNYPPGVYDADATTFCVGLEEPIPAG